MATVKPTYDIRVSEIIARTSNTDLFPEFDIRRSTRDWWVRRGPRDVVGLDDELEERARLLFSIQQHNTVMPHSAFEGQTPG